VVRVPALRERPADIEPLARHFLSEAQARFGLPETTFSSAAIAALQAWSWPGNIRELRNVVERAVLLAGESVLEPRPPKSSDVARGPRRWARLKLRRDAG